MKLFGRLFGARSISKEELNGKLFSTIEYYNVTEKRNITEINRILKQGADANTKNSKGVTALGMASKNGHLDVVKALLEKGADVNAKYEDERTALMVASSKGYLDVVKVLLAHDADVNAKTINGITALVMAYSDWEYYLDVLKLLLKHDADVNARNCDGKTTLISASDGRGRIDVVRLMLDHGADVNATDDSGKTALMCASFHGRLDLLKELLEKGADVNAKDSDGRSALVFAYSEAHYWLHREGHHAVIKELLEKGADIKVKDKYGKTLLKQVSKLENYQDVVTILRKKRADVKVDALLDETKRTSAPEGCGNNIKSAEVLIFKPIRCLKCKSILRAPDTPFLAVEGEELKFDSNPNLDSAAGELACSRCGEKHRYLFEQNKLTLRRSVISLGDTEQIEAIFTPHRP